MRVAYLIFLIPTLALAAEDSPLVIIDGGKKTPPAVTAPAPAAPPAAASTTTATAKPSAPPAAASAEAMINDFPTWAISKAGSDTTGQTAEAAPLPQNPPEPNTAVSPSSPVAPPAPAAPENPVSKLWPRDTVPIFMRSCTGLHVEYVPACSCVVGKLMLTIPHDEFLTLAASDALEKDPRLIKIRSECLATPAKKAE